MQIVYAILCILGTVIPLSQLFPWLGSYGFDVPLLVQQAFATPISAFAWSDVVVTGLVSIVLIIVESKRLNMQHGWIALLGLLVGPSLALPLFLWMRERHLVANPV